MIQDLTPVQAEILSRLDVVAVKLGVATEHLWGLFTTQSIMMGIGEFIANFGASLVFGIVAYITYRGGDWFDSRMNLPTGRGILGGISLLLFIVTLIVSITCIPQNISQIFNPEYFAWKEIRSILS